MSESDPTLQEVGQAVHLLREEIESKSLDPAKVERINTFLDGAEEKNQKLVAAEKKIETHEAEVKDFREALEKSGISATEAKSRIDALETQVARGISASARYQDSDEYKALNQWCRDGELSVETKALLRTDSAVAGGLLVLSEMDTEITKKIVEVDPIRTVARVRTTGSKSLEVPIRNTIPVASYEGEAETGTDSISSYEAETMTPFRQTFTSGITQDMLQDAAFDMESEITEDAGLAFGFGEGNNFVLGDGFKKPAGFAVNAILQAAARETTAADVIDANAIILLTGDLKVGYNPVYVLNRRTLALIRTFRGDAASAGDQAGQYLWMPGMNGPVANTINGFPYILANSMPDVATSAYPIAFGDFRRGYTIVDRTGLSVIRDELTLKKKAVVEFTMNRWNTAQVTLPEAIKLLKVKA